MHDMCSVFLCCLEACLWRRCTQCGDFQCGARCTEKVGGYAAAQNSSNSTTDQECIHLLVFQREKLWRNRLTCWISDSVTTSFVTFRKFDLLAHRKGWLQVVFVRHWFCGWVGKCPQALALVGLTEYPIRHRHHDWILLLKEWVQSLPWQIECENIEVLWIFIWLEEIFYSMTKNSALCASKLCMESIVFIRPSLAVYLFFLYTMGTRIITRS